MSRRSELTYYKWYLNHIEECKRDLVVGAKVYRCYYGVVEEGVVERIFRCYIDMGGNTVEKENGSEIGYFASFRNRTDWHSQTFQWRWFYDIDKAREELVKEYKRDIENLRHRIEEKEKLVSEVLALLGISA